MDVLTLSVPRLDRNRPEESFQKIQDYLCQMMEQIDYTLSRHGMILGETNLEGTEQKLEQMSNRITSLSSLLSSLNGGQAALSKELDAIEGEVETLRSQVDVIKENMLELGNRVSALENADVGGA